MMMGGWKVWAGAGVIAVSAILRYFGQNEIADLVITVGMAIGLVGVGHKIEKKK
jgi:hypothetical protein